MTNIDIAATISTTYDLSNEQTHNILMAVTGPAGAEIVARSRHAWSAMSMGGTERLISARPDGKRGFVATYPNRKPATFRTKREATDYLYKVNRFCAAIVAMSDYLHDLRNALRAAQAA